MKTLMRKLMTRGMIAVSSILLPANANVTKQYINPFIQPSTSLNYYGSGDVNNDGKIDAGDVSRLDSLIAGTFSNPNDKRLYDRADIDGNQVVNSTDKQTLENYLNAQLPHLPSQWNVLSRDEKVDWLNKMLAVDKTDTLKWIEGQWVSGNFATQLSINFRGFNGEIPSRYDSQDNRRFNIPLFSTAVTRPWHGIAWVSVGENILNYSDGYLVEPQNDNQVQIGGWNLFADSSDVRIEELTHLWNDGRGAQTFLEFVIHDSVPSLSKYDTGFVELDKPTSIKEVAEQKALPRSYYLEQNFPNPFNPKTTLRYTLPEATDVKLEVYNLLGQKLETLVDGKQTKGEYQIPFNASGLPSGIYIYRISSPKFSEAKKMTLVK